MTVLKEKLFKPIKLTDAQLASQARARIVAAHADPFFDLAVEPWIPVVRDGSVVLVGLRQLLVEAHRFSDLALPNPLLRAAMRRYLEALTVDLVRRDTRADVEVWEDRHVENEGFAAGLVEHLLATHREHLWLWHPVSPFLQNQRLATDLSKPQVDKPAQELVLHLPTSSSAAWWVKADEPLLVGGLSAAETARWVVVRWFYAVNGNSAAQAVPGGTVISQSGGAFAETVATITHAFRVDGISLFRSLLRGIPASLQNGDAAGELCWLDMQRPRPNADPAYQATMNASAILLASRDAVGATVAYLPGSGPVSGDIAKALSKGALAVDAHRITAPNAKGEVGVVRVQPGALRSDVLEAFHRAGFDSQTLHGVVNSADCWLRADADSVDRERLELLLVSKGGTGSSPVWEDLAGIELPARHLDPAHPNSAVVEHIRASVQVAFAPKEGVRPHLERAVADLLAQPGPDGWKAPKRDNATFEALTAKAVATWLAATAAAFEEVLDASGRPDAPAALDRWRELVWRAAREAFEQTARPYITSTRYAPRYATALRHLTPRSSS